MMMKEIKSPFWRTIYEYGLITVSIWIMVVGIYFSNSQTTSHLVASPVFPLLSAS